jgi:hypothetical protein
LPNSTSVWNIENLGKSKSNNEIAFMANTIKEFDIIAIQSGKLWLAVEAVARLADELNRKVVVGIM